MTRASANDNRRQFTIADLNTKIGDEPRVLDVTLASNLGMAQPRDIRGKIKANLVELSMHGKVCAESTQTSTKGGRPGSAYYLNEPQALLICMWSNTAKASAARKLLIDVFMEYRRGKLEKPISVREHDRRTSTKIDDALRLKTNVDRLEKITKSIQAKPQNFCAMVIDGEHVFIDTNDYDVRGERAAVLTWDGRLAIMEADSHLAGNHKFAGVRSAHGPRVVMDVGTSRAGVIVLGKVMGQGLDVRRDNFVAGSMEKLTTQITTLLEAGSYSDAQIAKHLCCAPKIVRDVRRVQSKNIKVIAH